MNTVKKRIANMLKEKSKSEYPLFPKKNLLIEVTNYCNNKCLFCANRKMTRKRGFIEDETVEKALKECYKLGTREVGFYATGEPLMNKKLENYILLAKEIGYEYVYLTTNGILANKERINNIFKSGLDSLKFSINAIEEDTYKLIHGTDNFKLVLNNLRSAYNLKNEKYNNVKVSVSYIMTKYSLKEKSEIENFFKDISDEVIIDMAKNQGGLIQEIDYLVDNSQNIKLPCFYVFHSVNITYEGYITACCMDFQNYLAYANIKKISIEEAWKNEIITKLRKNHLLGNVDGTICENCIKGTFNTIKPINCNLATIINNYNIDLPKQLIK